MDADTGNGPVDSIYRAINRIVQVPNELIEFTVQSVTEGIDAMADVTIRIKAEGNMIYTGHAANTDIFVASTKAYLQALNKQIAPSRGAPQKPSVSWNMCRNLTPAHSACPLLSEREGQARGQDRGHKCPRCWG